MFIKEIKFDYDIFDVYIQLKQ
ncbi:hypothetical protein THF5H11_70101 [Vibrio jasicida]|nr:hypothetical protein THF5H11_70101 [Vibrio jasicida]